MKLKLVAPLLLSLFTTTGFAHGDHDDHGPAVKPGKQVSKEAPVSPAADPKVATPVDDKPVATPKAPAPKTP